METVQYRFLREIYVRELGWFRSRDGFTLKEHPANSWVTLEKDGADDMLVDPRFIIIKVRK